ncbi:MAG: YciI family protein [Bauldia sp.]|nr:YciI family protein [Bauldia sp.]
MRYMLLIHFDDTQPTSPEEWKRLSGEYAAWLGAMKKAGVGLGSERLQPSATATSVRVRDGKTEVVDGPYAETKEQFAGYYLIECEGLDEAVQWAARCPGARAGTIEIRPLWSNKNAERGWEE